MIGLPRSMVLGAIAGTAAALYAAARTNRESWDDLTTRLPPEWRSVAAQMLEELGVRWHQGRRVFDDTLAETRARMEAELAQARSQGR